MRKFDRKVNKKSHYKLKVKIFSFLTHILIEFSHLHRPVSRLYCQDHLYKISANLVIVKTLKVEKIMDELKSVKLEPFMFRTEKHSFEGLNDYRIG